MSSLVVLCFSSYYRFVLLLNYELVPPRASVAYVQTISSDVAQASLQLVPLLVSHVCHRSGPDLFLCDHKSIVACGICRLYHEHNCLKINGIAVIYY
jgi:hypothetical protein